jgi:hypothetical protein
MRGIRTWRLSAVVAAVAVVAAACGSSGGAVTAPNTPKQIAADKKLATQAVLRLTDLPDGYKATPHDNSSGDDSPPAVEAQFVKCSGLPKKFLDTTNDDQPNADSPDFTKGSVASGDFVQIQSNVELDRSSKDISAPLALLREAKTVKCFGPALSAEFSQGLKSTPGVSLSHVSVVSVDAGSIGDQSAGLEGRVTMSTLGLSFPVAFDFYVVRRGRAAATLDVTGIGKKLDTATAAKLLRAMVDRLGAAACGAGASKCEM